MNTQEHFTEMLMELTHGKMLTIAGNISVYLHLNSDGSGYYHTTATDGEVVTPFEDGEREKANVGVLSILGLH